MTFTEELKELADKHQVKAFTIAYVQGQLGNVHVVEAYTGNFAGTTDNVLARQLALRVRDAFVTWLKRTKAVDVWLQ